MKKSALYALLAVACIVSYGWILYALTWPSSGFTPCFFKNLTGIACPSCGTTRAVLVLAQGDLKSSLAINPVGILAAMMLVAVPLMLIYDLIARKQLVFDLFKKTEAVVRTRPIAIILLILIVLNWMWNIQKNL